MRSLLCMIGGSAVAIGTLLDVLRTVLSMRGGGAVALAVTDASWSLLSRLGRLTGSRRPWLMAGPVAVVATMAAWGLLSAAGWALFLSGATLVDASRWPLVPVVACVHGLVLIALTLAYLLPVVRGALQARQLALGISYLAPAGDQLVPRAWDGIGFDTLAQQLMALTPMVIQAGQSYRAYPVLRHFHQAEPEESLSLGLVHLDRALFLLEHGVAEGHRPPRLVTEPLRRAIGAVTRVDLGDGSMPDQALLAPRLQGLIEASIPTVDLEEYQQAVTSEQRRRRVLLAMVLDDGWGSLDMNARTSGASRVIR